MRLIKLTKNQFAKVDDQDYNFLNQWKWQYNGGYAIHASRTNRLAMHKLLLNVPEGKFVDHINGDKLDNRKGNLRVATRSQNQWNRGISKNNTSGVTGVYWAKHMQKWNAQITINGTNYNLGCFIKIEDAVFARNEAIKYRGEFGRRVELLG